MDAVLLSAVTGKGPYWKEAFNQVSKTLYDAECHINYRAQYDYLVKTSFMKKKSIYSIQETIASCAVKAAFDIGAKLIIVYTSTGNTAKKVAKYRPECPILAVTASDMSPSNVFLSKGIYFI